MTYLFAVTLLWAFSFSLIGVYLAGQVDAWFSVLMRIGLATCVFLPFLHWRKTPKALALKLMAIGAVQLGVMYSFYYHSFLYLSVPEVLLFTVMTPLYITLLNDILEKRFNAKFLLAAMLAIVGAVAIRYEGIDERIIDAVIDEEWSVGDYVLSGGELPAMIMIDAISRLLPGVLGHQDSAEEDSFTDGLLDCPHYTRPESYTAEGYDRSDVPSVLLSGNHKAIKEWRLKQSLGRTWERRPELIAAKTLDAKQKALLNAYIDELRSDC